MQPSINRYERREYSQGVERRRGVRKMLGFLILIVLTLGVLFIIADLFTFPEVQAAPVVDDKFLCENLENYSFKGMEAEVLAYCARYGN